MTIGDVILKKNTENVNTKDVELVPCGRRVIFLPYDENPYRLVEKSEAGVIFGIESSGVHHSNETGEYEENEQMIVCAKVIAVGPDCKYTTVGSDIYVMKGVGSTPVPFRKKGYHIIDEQNVLCSINEI